MAKNDLPSISLFSGGLGLDLGLEKAGFTLGTTVECNVYAAETIRQNRPDTPLIDRKLELVPTKEILKSAGLKVGEAAIVNGGPSCQSFSTAGRRGSVGDPRGVMFRQFLRVVKEAKPRFFVMENVKGVLSAAIKHRPLKERGPGHPVLEPDEALGSAFRMILKELRATGYYVVFEVLNAADFGIPQTRERVIFIGSRDGAPVKMPSPTHSRDSESGLLPWVDLRQALDGLDDADPIYSELCPSKKRFLKLITEGCNWRDLPKKLQAEALGGAHTSWGGRCGFFRRLSWDLPAPSLTTKPDSKATMLCHPDELRPLSVGEYTRLQQFPDDWKFAGGVAQQYIQAGNAVPVGLGHAIGLAIRKAMRQQKRKDLRGKVVCHNADLLERMAKRPRTVLNPSRMRIDGSIEAAREWLASQNKYRHQLLDFLDDSETGKKRRLVS